MFFKFLLSSLMHYIAIFLVANKIPVHISHLQSLLDLDKFQPEHSNTYLLSTINNSKSSVLSSIFRLKTATTVLSLAFTFNTNRWNRFDKNQIGFYCVKVTYWCHHSLFNFFDLLLWSFSVILLSFIHMQIENFWNLDAIDFIETCTFTK